MAANLNLYVNWYTQRFMKSPRNSALFVPPNFHENDIIPIVIQVLQPDPDTYNGFTTPDISSMSLSFTMEDTSDGEVVVAQYTWSKDLTTGRFSAEVDFGTATLNTWIGESTTKSALLKIKKTEGTSTTTLISQNATIEADGTDAELGDVLPTQTPLSKEEALQLFMSKFGNSGDTLTLVSPDGTRTRTLGIDDNGISIDSTGTIS